MTLQQLYRECERLYYQVDWSDKESVKRYNEKIQKLHKKRQEEEKRENRHNVLD